MLRKFSTKMKKMWIKYKIVTHSKNEERIMESLIIYIKKKDMYFPT